MALIALTVVLGSQLLRVAVTLQAFWLRGEVGTLGVIPVALLPFVLAFSAVLVARGSVDPGILGGVVVLVVARLLEQISHTSVVNIWASTFNIAQGIAVGGQLDPEEAATVISESGATVIGLQEVSRNFLISSGTDLV